MGKSMSTRENYTGESKDISAVLPQPGIPGAESIKAYQIVGQQVPCHEDYEIAKDFILIAEQKAAQGNGVLELSWLALQIYTAGKLAGIKKERARKKDGVKI